MPQKNVSHANRDRLMSTFGIEYTRDLPAESPCQNIFREIENIGRPIFKDYKAQVTIEAREKPWRRELVQRVSMIVAKAVRYSDAGTNEETWRSAVEHHIFERFDYEVSCNRCRARVWRSDFEASVADSHAKANALRKRQAKRKTCTCKSSQGEQLNNIFDYRVGHHIRHKDGVNEYAPYGEYPDRGYGLLCTPRMQKVIRAALEADHSPGSPVELSPFLGDRKPVYFPFLVLESKSGVSKADEHAIFLQSMFAARRFLLLQNELQEWAGKRAQLSDGPFVWVLSNRGSQWFVAGAYISNLPSKSPETRIVRVYQGDITDHDDALRLLLIFDYIVDWARDVYRRDILESFESLIHDDMASLVAGTDIPSMLDLVSPLRAESGTGIRLMHHVPHVSSPSQIGTAEFLEFFDTKTRSVRDMEYMHYRLYGLQITDDNVDQLLASEPTQECEKSMAENLLKSFVSHGFCLLTLDTLHGLEKVWTGEEPNTIGGISSTIFMVLIWTHSFFEFAPTSQTVGRREPLCHWQQVHELSYIAVSPTVVEALRLRTNLKEEQCPKSQNKTSMAQDQIVQLFSHGRTAPVRQCLAAAIDQQALILVNRETMNDVILKRLQSKHKLRVWDLPKSVYRSHKIGRKEPTDSYICASRSYGQRNGSEESQGSNWPKPRIRIPDNEFAVLVIHSPYECLFFHRRYEAMAKASPLCAFTSFTGRKADPQSDCWLLYTPILDHLIDQCCILEIAPLRRNARVMAGSKWHEMRLSRYQELFGTNSVQGGSNRTNITKSLQELLVDYKLQNVNRHLSERISIKSDGETPSKTRRGRRHMHDTNDQNSYNDQSPDEAEMSSVSEGDDVREQTEGDDEDDGDDSNGSDEYEVEDSDDNSDEDESDDSDENDGDDVDDTHGSDNNNDNDDNKNVRSRENLRYSSGRGSAVKSLPIRNRQN